MAHRGPSPHLSWKELKCKDGTPYPVEWRNSQAIFLGRLFEAIRAACGHKPINVVSGYRTQEWNEKIGGAPDSQHLYGRALDLKPPKGMNIDEFYDIIRRMHISSGLRGLGLYPTHVHVDVRPTEFLVKWSGKAMKDDRPAD